MSLIPIIGTGAVCSAGYGVKAGYKAISEGKICLTPLSLFECGLKGIPLCGQVKENHIAKPGTAIPNRTIGLAMCAAHEALDNVKIHEGLRFGIVVATTVAGMTKSEIFYRELRKNPDYIKNAAKELAFHEPTALSSFLAAHFNAQGFHTLSTACSTGLHALGIAKRLLEQNSYDLCLALGVDALSLLTLRGFASLMLIDYSGCKPFDKRRVGISLGEGAGALLLASEKAVQQLGIKPIAAVSAWGASADCHHMTAPHPDGEGAIRATTSALKEAGIGSSDIGMIAAHGTGTPDNDISEIKAMRAIFKPMPPFCSMKGTLGHTLAASGALEAVFAVCALNDNKVPPTANFEQPDEAVGAKPSPGEAKMLKHILKNSFGFGGNNAVVVISKWKEE